MRDTFASSALIQSPRGSYKIRLPQYQNGETGGQIQNDGTLPPHISNGGSSSMAALYGFPPYQSQYQGQGQDSHMNMGSNQNMTGNGGGNGVDYSSACNMNMSSHSSNIGQGQNPNSIGHNNAGNNDGQSMIPGYSLPTGIPMGGGNNGQSTLGAINGTVGSIHSFFHAPVRASLALRFHSIFPYLTFHILQVVTTSVPLGVLTLWMCSALSTS